MSFMEKIKSFNKKTVYSVLGGVVLGIFIGIVMSPTCSDTSHDGIKEKNKELTADVATLKSDVTSKNAEIETLNAKINQAKPWFDMKEEEQRKIAEENARIEAEKKAEEERKAEEARKAEEKRLEEERIAKENAEKNKYETGITYEQLARTPDDYMAKLCKFKGEVIQVIEGDNSTQIRFAVGGNYDKVILAEFTKDTVSSRILEDDYITIYGMSMGLITYESTMGGNITIPSILVEKIDQ